MNHHRSLTHVASLLIVGLLAGCGGDTTEPESQEPEPQEPVLASVSGNGQSATVGQSVSDPLVVRITRAGSGVAGMTVSWTVTGGGGSVDPTSSSTDNAGMASTTWTLGSTAGPNTVEALASGVMGSPVTFTATGTPDTPPPAQAAVSVGDNFFNPASQRVAVGGTVTWTWTGAVGHNVTFSSGTNSVTQSSGTFDRDFSNAGSFDYECTIHAGMDGTIVVE